MIYHSTSFLPIRKRKNGAVNKIWKEGRNLFPTAVFFLLCRMMRRNVYEIPGKLDSLRADSVVVVVVFIRGQFPVVKERAQLNNVTGWQPHPVSFVTPASNDGCLIIPSHDDDDDWIVTLFFSHGRRHSKANRRRWKRKSFLRQALSNGRRKLVSVVV